MKLLSGKKGEIVITGAIAAAIITAIVVWFLFCCLVLRIWIVFIWKTPQEKAIGQFLTNNLYNCGVVSLGNCTYETMIGEEPLPASTGQTPPNISNINPSLLCINMSVNNVSVGNNIYTGSTPRENYRMQVAGSIVANYTYASQVGVPAVVMMDYNLLETPSIVTNGEVFTFSNIDPQCGNSSSSTCERTIRVCAQYGSNSFYCFSQTYNIITGGSPSNSPASVSPPNCSFAITTPISTNTPTPGITPTPTPEIKITSVDIQNRSFVTQLISNGESGNMSLVLHSSAGDYYLVNNVSRPPGIYTDTYTFSDFINILPNQYETISEIRAVWHVGSYTANASISNKVFSVIPNITFSCYSTANEADYHGSGSTTAICTVTNHTQCTWSGLHTYYTRFLNEVSENGSGQREGDNSLIRIDWYCTSTCGDFIAYDGLTYYFWCPAPFIQGSTVCGESLLTANNSVARRSSGSTYFTCNDQLMAVIDGSPTVLNVQDTGGAVANDQLDVYRGSYAGACLATDWGNTTQKIIRLNR